MPQEEKGMSINVLLAIMWIKQAWEAVSANTIKNCFRCCGAIRKDGRIGGNDDPFTDLDADTGDMANLNELVQQMDCDVTAEQYINDEEDLTTCFTFDGASETNWREKLRAAVISVCCSATCFRRR